MKNLRVVYDDGDTSYVAVEDDHRITSVPKELKEIVLNWMKANDLEHSKVAVIDFDNNTSVVFEFTLEIQLNAVAF